MKRSSMSTFRDSIWRSPRCADLATLRSRRLASDGFRRRISGFTTETTLMKFGNLMSSSGIPRFSRTMFSVVFAMRSESLRTSSTQNPLEMCAAVDAKTALSG